ncbi:MAG: hypothetical protein KTR18_05010 [Acidiferrobacterales bacterium]|nr:hypothetical protein [Acidiferrobacterales bacterium]
MIKSAVARTPILVFILMFFALGYTVAHNKVVVVPLGADAGVSGLEVVQNSVSINPGEFSTNTISIDCPSGKKALGGGVTTGNKAHVLRGSYPETNATGWQGAIVLNSGNTPVTATANIYAICADVIN